MPITVAGTLAGSRTRLNPYKLGLELYRDIETAGSAGAFGEDYDKLRFVGRKRRWNTKAGKGREKIFEVRRVHNDLTFIDEFSRTTSAASTSCFPSATARVETTTRSKVGSFTMSKSGCLQPNERRSAVDLRPRRQLQEPRRIVPEHRFSGVELQANYAQGHALARSIAVETAGAHRNGDGRENRHVQL